jgi:hypothetical protein
MPRKPGPPPEWDSEIEAVLSRWPHLPRHVRKTVVELVSHYGPPPTEAHFPTPEGASWSDVEFVMLSPSAVRITVGSVSQRYTFASLGLNDRRQPHLPRSEWRMLRTYAEHTEPDAYFRLPQRKNLKVDISRFRSWLKSFFGLPGDPLRPFQPSRWLPRFRIRADY